MFQELNAYEYIAEFIDCTNEDISINELACELYTLYLDDMETDFFEGNHAETKESQCAQNSGSSETEICTCQIVDDFQATKSHPCE